MTTIIIDEFAYRLQSNGIMVNSPIKSNVIADDWKERSSVELNMTQSEQHIIREHLQFLVGIFPSYRTREPIPQELPVEIITQEPIQL